jgi:hypothetical protein
MDVMAMATAPNPISAYAVTYIKERIALLGYVRIIAVEMGNASCLTNIVIVI